MPKPYVKKVPIIRRIPVPVPNKKSVPDTKLVNETNVKIVGYQKPKKKEKHMHDETCSSWDGYRDYVHKHEESCESWEEPLDHDHDGLLLEDALRGEYRSEKELMYQLDDIEKQRRNGVDVHIKPNFEGDSWMRRINSNYGSRGGYSRYGNSKG